MNNCIICNKETKLIDLPNIKAVIPMGNKLIDFQLLKCNTCGHLQKKIDKTWKRAMKGLYSQKYLFLGKHISLDGKKVINRNDQSTDLINKSLKLGDNGNFLDIGCGVGHFIKSFLNIKKDWHTYAHDLSELNKKKVLKYNVKKFYTGNVNKIKKKFDLISMNHVLEHLISPVDTLRDVRNILKDNGNLILRLPNINQVHTDLTILDHCSHFNYNSLKNLLNLTGFKIKKSFNNLNPIELFVILEKTKKNKKINNTLISQKKLSQLFWPEKTCEMILKDKTKSIGVFGVGTASFYLLARLRKKISFFVDEDPLKINKNYYNKRIYSVKNIPKKSNVYIPIHNKNFAEKIKKRIGKINKKINFLVPNQ